jgi:hypothetical protein
MVEASTLVAHLQVKTERIRLALYIFGGVAMRALTEVSVAERFKKLEGTHLGTCAQTFELRLQAVFGYYGLHRLLRGIDTVHLCITCHKASGLSAIAKEFISESSTYQMSMVFCSVFGSSKASNS